MRKTLITLCVALSAIGIASAAPTAPSTKVATAVAAKSGEHSFSRDGYTYVYKVIQDAKGRTLSGARYPDGDHFTLTVAGNRVIGDEDGVPVDFPLSEALGR